MPLARRERFEFPDFFRRFFDADLEASFVRVEEFLDGKTLVIRAELPDVDPDKDVELSITNDTLHIRAEREHRTEHKDKESYRSEFRYGSFARTIPLPAGTRGDEIEASYNDGVLEIRIPVAEQLKEPATKISISRG